MNNEAQREPILKLTNIHKAFGGVQALVGADFDLRPGEIHALVGENGAGKSTLVKVITGVHQLDAGDILFRDEPVAIANPLIAQRLGIAAIYQEATLFPDLDIAENIFMGHHPVRPLTRRIAWRQMYEQAAQPLRALGVDLDPHTRVRELTIAQLQMVQIAKALSAEAQVLIMDEPTSALTLHEVADLFRIARQLRDAGTAIIFISHRLD
jgi:rhamnose transport system ATP-binding protein